MSKPYRENDLYDQLDQDLNWRRREISDLKQAIKNADAISQRVLLRALTTMCYAHWEGAVRFAARKYMDFVALRKFSFGELDRQFVRNYFMPRLAALASSKGSLEERCALVDDILTVGSKRFTRVNEDLIQTGGNLKFDVFADICRVCGVSKELFQDEENFINIFLLKRRNSIAHGDDTFIALQDMDDMVDRTIGLIQTFKSAIANIVTLQGFKAASPGDVSQANSNMLS